MRIHRFYTPFFDFNLKAVGLKLVLSTANSEAHETDYKALFHQWKDVFNYTAGSQVILFDGKGGEVLAMIEEIGWAEASLVIIENLSVEGDVDGGGSKESYKNRKDDDSEENTENNNTTISAKGVWLFSSIVKGDNFDWIIQKTTELGVDHVVPILSDRTIKKNINLERSKKIAVEASEQSGRKTVPIIHKPIKLEEAVEKFIEMKGSLFVCMQGGESFTRVKSVDGLAKEKVVAGEKIEAAEGANSVSEAVGFVIGPEGGWTDREEMYFKRHNIKAVSLGKNVLRAETAAVAVMAVLVNL